MSFEICQYVAGSMFPPSREYKPYMLRGWGYKKNYACNLEDVGIMFFRNVSSL